MGDMGDASGQYLHGQSFTYKPLHMVTDEGGGGGAVFLLEDIRNQK